MRKKNKDVVGISCMKDKDGKNVVKGDKSTPKNQ